MDFDLLTNIIEAYKKYQLTAAGGKKSHLTDFFCWGNEQAHELLEPENFWTNGKHKPIRVRSSHWYIGDLFEQIFKTSNKKGLANFPELVSEDFTYLYTLTDVESMTKIQLIEKNVHEKPTGLEVIKRLLKHGLVDERNDETDKRSKKGFSNRKRKSSFFATIEQMNKVALIVSGNLTQDEKKQLHILLKKLEDFHKPIYLSHKEISIDQLVEKTNA